MPHPGEPARSTRPPFRADGKLKVLPLQPHPIKTKLAHLCDGGKVFTHLGRTWKEGETGHSGRCLLCPAGQCVADADNQCDFLLAYEVAEEEAELHSPQMTPGIRWQSKLGPAPLDDARG